MITMKNSGLYCYLTIACQKVFGFMEFVSFCSNRWQFVYVRHLVCVVENMEPNICSKCDQMLLCRNAEHDHW